MGVRYLWLYVRSTLCRTFQLTAKDVDNPTLVIDLLSGSRRYLQNDYIWDFQKLKDRVRADVQALRRAGFQLHVFTDGGLGQHRFENWFHRRKLDLDRLYKLNSLLLSESPERSRISSIDWRPPLSIAHYLTQAFYHADCDVHIAQESADHEGAGLSIKHDAFGVLTNDTDFLIFPGIGRFLYLSSMRVEENGDVFVQGVDRSLFLRYLGISEEKLPMIVGFLGNDQYNGVTMRDAKYLQYKWKLEYLAEAAAMEVMNAPTALLPATSRLALDYYKPIIPKSDPAGDQIIHSNPEWKHLEETKRLARGIAYDSLSEKPCHEVLFPLRQAVYARNGFHKITEFVCYPHSTPETWKEGKEVEMTDEVTKAPEPPSDIDGCLHLCCGYLKATGELEEFHYKALILQWAQNLHGWCSRDELLGMEVVRPSVPNIKDLHIANLFLQTVEIMYLGSKNAQPLCWELFQGPLFHYLCQERNIVEAFNLPSTSHASFDWNIIIKPHLLANEIEI